MKWVIGLVIVAALGWFGYQYVSKNAAIDAQNLAAEAKEAAQAEIQEARDSATQALTAAQDAMPAGIDLGKISDGLDGSIATATDALSGISDVESAKAALPALESANETLSGLSETINRLPDAAKGPLGSIVSGSLGSIKPVIEKAQSLPGVGEVITPLVTPLLETLESLAAQ